MTKKTTPTGMILALLFIVILSESMILAVSAQDMLAFPGAEGFGAYSKGGRGGRVLHVTTLADEGPGSLRWAVEQKGPRTIVFEVSGTIKLKSGLKIGNPFITIAGQTAPGDGICLRDSTLGIETHDVIVRYLRCRLGNRGRGGDAIGISKGEDIIVDHCSASWSTDEVLSASSKTPALTRVTVQWCFITEALNPKGHGFGSLIRGTGGAKYSFLHNLYAHNRGRNPRPGNYDSNPHDEDPEGLLLDFRNNVIYNWEGGHAGYNNDGKSVTRLNYVGNYLIPGANSKQTGIAYSTKSPYNRAFFAGNVYNDQLPDDPWDLVRYSGDWTDDIIRAYKQSQPFETGPIHKEDARTAFQRVMRSGGACLPKRDAVDIRVVNDVQHRSGRIIKSQEDVGGWPSLNTKPPPADTDRDGMPDAWEGKYGFDLSDACDTTRDKDGDGYTNLEEYLNGTDPAQYVDYRNPKNNKNTLSEGLSTSGARRESDSMFVLDAGTFKHHVDLFNSMDPENIVNYIPNRESWAWMTRNIPFFECPDKSFEQIYYFRWWTFRKHLKKTADGFVFTEFLDKVGHSGRYNTISCALGHHIYEGTWLRNKRYIDEYARFWYVGHKGSLQPHFHRYSNWGTWALHRRYLVNQDKVFVVGLLDAFIRDYEAWTKEQGLENGLFWQYDVRDGMEESISGSRRIKNARPPLNSYMYANAVAISKVAEMAGKEAIAKEYAQKAARLKSLVHRLMWDDEAKFFKVRRPNGQLADVREQIGFIPWYFDLPEPGYEQAWQQLTDPQGFKAAMGITTAERRHPQFRTHGVGTCEWDGAVWPYATSQTLVGLANVIRNYQQQYVSKVDYFDALLTYARSHRHQGKPYIGEYLDEKNGKWLKPDSDRSRYYNHSTFCDLVITGLVGLVPRQDNTVLFDPLVPAEAWDWFCLDNVFYHGRALTILWDRSGEKYHKGKGLRVFADGIEIAQSDELACVTGELP